ncbi:hypothetical protein ABH897_000802 [Paenibacillus sp. RC73]
MAATLLIFVSCYCHPVDHSHFHGSYDAFLTNADAA